MMRYGFGLLLSALSALLITTLGLLVLTDSSAAMLAVLAAVYLALPLLGLLLITWTYYLWRDRAAMPGQAHALILLPSLAAVLIVPLVFTAGQLGSQAFSAQHPPISEVHINLTGQDLWLDASGTSTSSGGSANLPMAGSEPERLLVWTRWPDEQAIAQGRFPYEGTRLKANVDSIVRQLGGSEENTLAPAPLRMTTPYPAADELPLVYQFYHYPDRIEVAAALARSSNLETSRARSLRHAPVLISAANLSEQTLVRVEIDGQALAMDIWGRALPPTRDCYHGYPNLGPALLPLDAPWQVRWQEAEAPGVWHQATVSLPPLALTDEQQKQARLPRVLLYITKDRQVLAERFQEIELADDRLGVANTGIPEGLSQPAPCGSAMERYDLNNVTPLSEPWRAPPARVTP
ncbi:hypothetical protein FB481_10547 [Pseudomonas sp. AG1028]|uniref:hypothetical protein n=1 Tax=Pseudomonas sp. AG1028 TaxID=2572911 RepID=UPI0011ACFCCC|nr:hypothetical protein [Pseudomonas sp. AG1028]TWE06565.1 hypothetical protein FB481_10547 [Pseudomonas sp. AG1028]